MSKRPCRTNLETLLLQTQVKLRLISRSADGLVTAAFARHGPYEIRLYEPPPGDFLFWMELFDHDIQFSTDSCGRNTLEDAVLAADDFITEAKQANEELARATLLTRRRA